MKKTRTRLFGILFAIAGVFAATSLNAGYRTTFKPCPDKPVAVIRCADGSGDCEAEDQLFCDDIIIQQ
tara:strand:+ start:51 stop:254 length:204 start_codon:yes stop_codon:yes gene_type:complete